MIFFFFTEWSREWTEPEFTEGERPGPGPATEEGRCEPGQRDQLRLLYPRPEEERGGGGGQASHSQVHAARHGGCPGAT